MVNIGCVLGSEAGHVLTLASIPADALVVGFSITSLDDVGSLALTYAYKV